MKYIAFITTGLLIFATTLFAHPAHATVGGPTTIERVSYNPSENAIYYLINSQTGRGCLPEIAKIDLATNNQTLVASCDQIEEKFLKNGGLDYSAYDTYTQSVFEKTTPLLPFDLSKNKFSADLSYTGEYKFSDENISSQFSIIIKQAGSIKGGVDIIGCYKKEPVVLSGFAIPDSNKVAIVASRIGDCFEGGYTKDDLFLISEIELNDPAETIRRNNFSAPRVNEGDIVIKAEAVKDLKSDNSDSWKYTTFSSILSLFLGIAIGFITRSLRRN